MQPEHQSGESLTDLERALQDLVPAPTHLDIGQTMFLAGQQSVRGSQSRRWLWPTSSACLALLSITLGILLALPDEPRVVYVPRSTSAPRNANPVPSPSPAADRHVNQLVDRRDFAEPSRIVPADSELSRLAMRERALQGIWDSTAKMPSAQQNSIKAIRYQDWRSLLNELSPADRPQDAAPPSLFQWSTLFNTKGS